MHQKMVIFTCKATKNYHKDLSGKRSVLIRKLWFPAGVKILFLFNKGINLRSPGLVLNFDGIIGFSLCLLFIIIMVVKMKMFFRRQSSEQSMG